jgi:hypothetical protein
LLVLASPLLAARAGVIFITPFSKENQNVNTFEILLWEMDWRAERDCLLAELTVQRAAA